MEGGTRSSGLLGLSKENVPVRGKGQAHCSYLLLSALREGLFQNLPISSAVWSTRKTARWRISGPRGRKLLGYAGVRGAGL